MKEDFWIQMGDKASCKYLDDSCLAGENSLFDDYLF